MITDIASQRHFEDLNPGEPRRSQLRQITETEIVEFARAYDPQWFHCDPEAAKASIFGGLIASGIQTAALWRLMDHEINSDIAFVCGLAFEQPKWQHELRPGDLIYAQSEMLDKRHSKKTHDWGVCRFSSAVRREDGSAIFTLININLVYTRIGAAKVIANGGRL